jgi:hypothetical protein
MSEVDKRCIYASSEHLKDKFIYLLYHAKGQNELVHNWTLGWCNKKKVLTLFSKCERERIG